MTERAHAPIAALSLLLIACSTTAPAPENIGVATMSAERVITLQLRAEGPGGEIGDALFTYAPDHPDYGKVLEHLGGLAPGESKPAPPWDN